MENKIKKIDNCLACGSMNLIPSLDLGLQPLANSYLDRKDSEENSFPLAVNLCQDCFHLQLTHLVDPSTIYKNYLYVSGTTQTLKYYSDWFAGFVTENISRNSNNILDIGCNDGTQLDYFKVRGFDTFGIDPAENLFPISSAKHTIICDFFTTESVSKIKVELDAITAQNVFAHNPNPYLFLNQCRKLMGEDTRLFIQTSQANMVVNNEFDTIYHEHVNFFNINSMERLVERAGLCLVDVIRTPIHGTSYLFVISKSKNNHYRIQNSHLLEKALTDKQTYADWESSVIENMKDLKSTLDSLKSQGYKIIGYGAAAKGNTLLNYIKFPLDYIIDDNPLKQNKFTPGCKIPIVGISVLENLQEKIAYLPLAWNFFEEIKSRIKKVRSNPHDKFIKYFPKVHMYV